MQDKLSKFTVRARSFIARLAGRRGADQVLRWGIVLKGCRCEPRRAYVNQIAIFKSATMEPCGCRTSHGRSIASAPPRMGSVTITRNLSRLNGPGAAMGATSGGSAPSSENQRFYIP